MLKSNAYRRLFAALLTLPNLTASFSNPTLLFLPGAPWNQDQRLVSWMGQDATATTWAITCTLELTATRTCDIPSPYLLYTIGPSTMHAINTLSAPNFDITCTLTTSLQALCSGHVTSIPWTTTMNAAFLSFYGHRAITVTDSFPISASSSTLPTSPPITITPSLLKTTSACMTGPTAINSAILTSFDRSTASGVGCTATGGLGGAGEVTSMTKSAQAPRVTSVLGIRIGMVAAVAVVRGAVEWEI